MIVSKQFIVSLLYTLDENEDAVEKILDKLSTEFNSEEFQAQTKLNIFQTDAKLDKVSKSGIEFIIILSGVSNDTKGIIKKIKSYIDTNLSSVNGLMLLKRRVYP